ncbi:MAG: GldG family protein [Clostridia bacterium]|nr:GldG family protein [Clostridia bacterium]
MDEKKINELETELETESKTENENLEEIIEETKKVKPKKIRNEALLKKGSYSVAITAIVLAGIVVFNILVGALSKRVTLEYDFSKDKKNSLSAENVDYIKNIKNNVDIILCSSKDEYPNYMGYYAANQYNVSDSGEDYYAQTLKIIDKYSNLTDKINIQYIDPQTSKFMEISSKFVNENPTYGDIIVSATVGKSTRTKVLKFADVYQTETDDTYSAYGVTSATITGNNIENALTGAISYVQSNKTKKVAFLTCHTSADVTADYKTLLTDNNFEIKTVEDKVLTKISHDFDSVVIPAPTSDYTADEIKVLSEFIDNDSKLGKGIIFFANVNAPYLTNLYDFLESYGITVENGTVFETSDGYHVEGKPTALISGDTALDSLTADMLCVTDNNVPLSTAFETRENLTVTALTTTSTTTIAAPKGSSSDFKDTDKYEKKNYYSCIQSQKLSYIDGTKEAKSYVIAFSSADFLSSVYNEESFSNKNLTLAVAERACGGEKSEISFVTKSIENESFAESVTQRSSNIVVILFIILLPIVMIAIGIITFIKRRNS